MTTSQSQIALDLAFPLLLDRSERVSLQRQLHVQLRQAIIDGRLPSGTQLPSTRALAQALGISRTVTTSAYAELVAEGYLEGCHGSGTYVAYAVSLLPSNEHHELKVAPRWLREAAPVNVDDPPDPSVIAFRLGIPATPSLPLRAWRAAWRSATMRFPPTIYGSLQGEAALQAVLAPYLGRSRGLVCSPDDIIITAGAGHAVDLIARATLSVGDAVGFEEPGYPAARQILRYRGGQVIPVPIDDDGLQVERLGKGSDAPLLVYTTPSHQYPLATRLSLSRRIALLAWAKANDSLIIEDDYDSEFRFDTSPLPPLASLDHAGHVAYIGTFSKILSPALRVGYIVVPAPLRRRIEMIRSLTGEGVSWPLPEALATLMSAGHLDRHIRRMRQLYAQKRQALAHTFAEIAPLAQIRGLEAGLHAYLELRPDLDAALVQRVASKRGVLITPLDAYYVGVPDRSGLLLGYGSLELPDIIQGAMILKEAIRQVAR